jgi:hypothetical protein
MAKDCWVIVSVDQNGEVRILKRSAYADNFFDDPEESIDYITAEATTGEPAGIYKMTLDVSMVYKLPDYKDDE